VIVSERQAQEAWDLLRSWARISDEGWDLDELARVVGRTERDVTDAYRAACKHVHPDRGGAMADFVKVDRAKYMLMAWIARVATGPVPAHGGVSECPRCLGKGSIILHRGIKQTRMQCATCQGNGELYDEKQGEGDRM
jgi:DnaJ-class molecular chaperone